MGSKIAKRHSRGEGFRFPSPLENPLSLKPTKQRGAAANVIQLRETCHSEAVTDVTAVGIRIQNVRENGLPRQSADWLAMTKPLTEWHWLCCGPHFRRGDAKIPPLPGRDLCFVIQITPAG